MSRKFFEELNIPDADINLGIGSGTHAEQVGRTMIEFEKVVIAEKPDWVVVVGDVFVLHLADSQTFVFLFFVSSLEFFPSYY